MIELLDVYTYEDSDFVLYRLLKERTPFQSISHDSMPEWEEHQNFIESNPYLHWYIIENDSNVVGSMYLSKEREIGISIFNFYKKRGYGTEAVNLLVNLHPGKFLANINQNNKAGIKFFEQFGAELIQNTYLMRSE